MGNFYGLVTDTEEYLICDIDHLKYVDVEHKLAICPRLWDIIHRNRPSNNQRKNLTA